MSEILKRLLTGLIFVITIVFGILLGTTSSFIVFSTYGILGIYEFFGLLKKTKFKTISIIYPTFLFGALYLLFFLCFQFKVDYIIPFSFTLISLFSLFVLELLKKQTTSTQNIGTYFLGFIYVFIPFLLLAYRCDISNIENTSNYWTLLGVFILIWTSDTFAYLIGKQFGKTKLFKRISPKKTIEGLIGGLFFSIISAIIISYFDLEHSFLYWIIITPFIVVFGVIGDLVESLLKRDLNVKDFGNILPGHGGILDRFDSIIFTIPFVVFLNLIVEYYFS